MGLAESALVTVEILYPTWNRAEFTRYSLGLLKKNTDWERVSRFVAYDDGSEDGTRRFLDHGANGLSDLVPAYEVRFGGWHSTGATMNDYIALADTELFVKIDNDIAMPPGWLPRLLEAAEAHPEFDLIGVEAGLPDTPAGNGALVTKAKHIGGVGLMRTKAFHHRKPVPLSLGKNGRAGFTIWQHHQNVRPGWLTPTMYAVQLDRLPMEPWRSLAARYIEKGWAREWDPYLPDMAEWWKWMPKRV